MLIEEDDEAPDFRLLDQNGDPWTLSAHRGTPVVIYFYPAAETTGCTLQACTVRDAWMDFMQLGTPVVGISPDEVDTLSAFVRNHELTHRLLSDPDHTTIEAYGAWGAKERDGEVVEGVRRSSVIVDAEGIVAAVYPDIDPAEQAAWGLEVVRELGR